jgi:hypothetical protein
MILPSTYITFVCAWKYHTEILELQRDAWRRNRSDVCAWKYHTEILELQRDGREIEVMYVLGSISKHIHHFYFFSISL